MQKRRQIIKNKEASVPDLTAKHPRLLKYARTIAKKTGWNTKNCKNELTSRKNCSIMVEYRIGICKYIYGGNKNEKSVQFFRRSFCSA